MQVKTIQNNILSRYAQHGRSLPRRKTRDPYAIHISEVMLQQTQVDRVIPYFHQWMKDFPDYASLAKASKTDLLKHRSWLWFNSRAIRLQECAKIITEKWYILKKDTLKIWKDSFIKNSKFKIQNSGSGLLSIRKNLQSFPGVGPYTSAAIMAFARNLEVPVIDTNIRRVLIFLFKLDEKISMQALENFATKIIPKGKSRDRHNALMDYGALELTARKTKIKPTSKQSKFQGSDREVRGRVIKNLVKSVECRVKSVEDEFPHKDVKHILKWMKEEWLIHIKKWLLTIAE